MEGIRFVWGVIGVESYVFAAALGGLVLLFLIRAVEHLRGRPIFPRLQDMLGSKVETLVAYAAGALAYVVAAGSALPRRLFAAGVQMSASYALQLLRIIERLLKRVLDTVRGKREFTVGGQPSSPFFEHIVPRHRRSNESYNVSELPKDP